MTYDFKALRHDELLDRLAKLAVGVGVRLDRGQELVVTAPIEALALVRLITRHAYQTGAELVTPIFLDEECTLARVRHAGDASFDTSREWLFEALASAYRRGAARLVIVGENPSLFQREDPDTVARATSARAKTNSLALEVLRSFDTNTTTIPYATRSWACAVFPTDPQDVAISKLWSIIFDVTLVRFADPVAAWTAHNAALESRARFLNERRLSALHFIGPGTDLRVGLADGHLWVGGATTAKNGISCNANLPTEEVFTAPHRTRVEGHATSTKPFALLGALVNEIRVEFVAGRVVKTSAGSAEGLLERLISTDEGARYLGEVALVPMSSRIAESGLVFLNTLLDENAASHVAFGQAHAKCFHGGLTATSENLAQRGANYSRIHADWMIGSPSVDVNGISEGQSEPIMRGGEWCF
jgi:aminopeptidase